MYLTWVKRSGLMISLALVTYFASAQTIYLNAKLGNDSNSGTKFQPLKSLGEAAKRVNAAKTGGASEIILMPGVYYLTQTAIFDNDRYTTGERLTIRADVLPDDQYWTPQKMPIIVTAVTLNDDGTGGEEAKGIQVEVSHVTVQGLRFTGSADYMYKDGLHIRRSYPIWRDGNTLTDLLVTQCLFTGDAGILPLHVGVIANGHGLVVDHCVFYNCKNPVVFWRAKGGTSNGNAMRYCLVYGSTFSGVWTVETNSNDFDFRNNILANCQNAWIREKNSTRSYQAVNCIFTDNLNMAGYGNATATNAEITTSDFLKLIDTKTAGAVQIELDQSKRNFLQLAKGSFGTELMAGLFFKN
jgi:hypothetical protein